MFQRYLESRQKPQDVHVRVLSCSVLRQCRYSLSCLSCSDKEVILLESSRDSILTFYTVDISTMFYIYRHAGAQKVRSV